MEERVTFFPAKDKVIIVLDGKDKMVFNWSLSDRSDRFRFRRRCHENENVVRQVSDRYLFFRLELISPQPGPPK